MRTAAILLLILGQILVPALPAPSGELPAGLLKDNASVNLKISITLKKASLREALDQISQLAGVKFVYDDELLKGGDTYSAKFKNKTTIEILDELLKDSTVGYVVQSENQIVLTKKSTIKKRFGLLKGRIINAVSGDPMGDANIEILSTNFGTASNPGGFFALRVPIGRNDVRVSVIGFKESIRRQVEIRPDKATYLTFRMEPTIIELAEVRVVSQRTQVPQHMAIEPTAIAIRRDKLIAIPAVGEPDLFRSLQALPGVSAPNDLSNELFIRGGDADQNLIMLDGAVVYSPYHMFGLAGAFNPDIIEQVNLSLGGFSARYGDRLSSVVDVRTLNGSNETVSGFANLSLLSSKFTAVGKPAPRVSWLVSGRRTYHDVAARLFVGKRVPYYFYDLYGKLVVHPSSKDLVFLSTFFSRDLFDHIEESRFGDAGDGYTETVTARFSWDNLIASGHWMHEFSPGNEFELQVSQSRNPSDFTILETFTAEPRASETTKEFVRQRNALSELSRNVDTDLNLIDRTLRLDWTLDQLRNHTLRFGGGYSSIHLNYFWENLFGEFEQDQFIVFFDKAPTDFDYRRRLQSTYFYAENLWRVNHRLSLRPGFRIEHRDYQNGLSFEPRLNLSYTASSTLELKAAYGRFTQGLATSAEEGFIRFLPVPFPAENDLPTGKANHFLAGLRWQTDDWQISGDVYYKSLDDLLKAISGVPEFTSGHGEAYGIELGAKKLGDRLSFEVNYALSYTKRHFDGQDYFSRFDQRHSFNSFGRYNLGKNWMLNFRWTLATGQPFTSREVLFRRRAFDPLTGEWLATNDAIESPKADFSSDRNTVRYPTYHRLDLGLVKRIQKRGWAILPYIQAVNVYYRRNVLAYDWEHDRNTGTIKRKTIPQLPVLPTFGVSFEF